MMEESVELTYSEDGVNNRAEFFLNGVVTPVIMFVEDKDKEYIYECILKEIYFPTILDKISVIAAGHFETEYISMTALKKYVENEFSDIEAVVLNQNNPVKFIS